jgi:hypothetical protein
LKTLFSIYLKYCFSNTDESCKPILATSTHRGGGEVGRGEGKYSTPLRQISKHLLIKMH